ncbi:MAG: hypothetical protein HOG49_09505 [Candidatus Scalindua sp.]|nr:hypothetical protein [Candidatus Scalindua sp.]
MLDHEKADKACKKIRSSLRRCSNSLWEVEKFEVTNNDSESYNSHEVISGLQGGSVRCVEPGTYTRLIRLPNTTVMSDTPAETSDLFSLAQNARGKVLIAGLGLGIAIDLIMQDKEVEHVTVIEISQEIIDLVGDHFKDKYKDRLTIINADILEWKAPKDAYYDYCWFDIWDNICTDNLKDMTKLKRKYAKKAERKGFWAEVECLRAKRRWG